MKPTSPSTSPSPRPPDTPSLPPFSVPSRNARCNSPPGPAPTKPSHRLLVTNGLHVPLPVWLPCGFEYTAQPPVLAGPMLVVEDQTTTVVPGDFEMTVLSDGSLSLRQTARGEDE